MPDDSLRRLASLCLVKCCFKETTLQQPILKGLFEFVTKQFIISKYSGYQMYIILNHFIFNINVDLH